MSRLRSAKMRAAIFRAVLLIAGNILLIVLLLIFLEGAASWMFALHQKTSAKQVAERLHTRYDSLLGWVSLPNVQRPSMYGPGAQLTTNSRGFRGMAEFSAAVPTDKIRAICSGDSFTLGYGVGDDDTWCQKLSKLDPRLQTVNMGQGGYGFDQAYLWFVRDGQQLQHQLHLFAFITEDLNRMTRADFLGYPKPFLALENGRLIVKNTPVPASNTRWLTSYLPVVRSLRLFSVAGAAGRRVRSPDPSATKPTFDALHELLPVVLADLVRRNAKSGSQLVLIHLPTYYELRSGTPDRWTAFFQQHADSIGFTFVSLFESFRHLSADSLRTLYLQPQDLEFQSAAGHFTRAGNEVVAASLYQKLIDLRLIPTRKAAKPQRKPDRDASQRQIAGPPMSN